MHSCIFAMGTNKLRLKHYTTTCLATVRDKIKRKFKIKQMHVVHRCRAYILTVVTIHVHTISQIRPRHRACFFLCPLFSSFCFHFVVKKSFFCLELLSPESLQMELFLNTGISWKAIKKKWKWIRESKRQNGPQNISLTFLEKHEGRHASCKLVEDIQWGKIRTRDLYWWQWKTNWNSNSV